MSHIRLRLGGHVSRSWAGQKVITTDALSAPSLGGRERSPGGFQVLRVFDLDRDA